MPSYPTTDPAMVAATIKLSQNPAVVKADPNSLFDNSFVNEAKQKGATGGS
jgi:hypothetical protein